MTRYRVQEAFTFIAAQAIEKRMFRWMAGGAMFIAAQAIEKRLSIRAA